jgi:hypothetical protein
VAIFIFISSAGDDPPTSARTNSRHKIAFAENERKSKLLRMLLAAEAQADAQQSPHSGSAALASPSSPNTPDSPNKPVKGGSKRCVE